MSQGMNKLFIESGDHKILSPWKIHRVLDAHGTDVGILLNEITGKTWQYMGVETGWVECAMEKSIQQANGGREC